MSEQKHKSPHILNAASNLLGICFIVLTSLKLLDKSDKTVIDDITIVAIVLFMGSCIFSFLSIRNDNPGGWMERVADVFFLGGLLLLFVTTILFSFNIIA